MLASCFRLRHFFAAAFTDNACINTWSVSGGKQLVAATETPSAMLRVDVESLTTLGPYEYTDKMDYELMTAHPVIYPDGSTYNLFCAVWPLRTSSPLESFSIDMPFFLSLRLAESCLYDSSN